MECRGKNETYPPGSGCRNKRVEVVNEVPNKNYTWERETEPRAGLEVLVKHWIWRSDYHEYGGLITELRNKLSWLEKALNEAEKLKGKN